MTCKNYQSDLKAQMPVHIQNNNNKYAAAEGTIKIPAFEIRNNIRLIRSVWTYTGQKMVYLMWWAS
jgi:hypothetical protein